MPYAIADLLDDRNRALHAEISEQIPIILEASKDECWGEIMRDGKGIIEFAESRYPIACFTHELLHLKYDLAGLQRPGWRVNAPPDKLQEENEQIQERLPFFYNQLIHQKLFDDFVRLGFSPSEFLAESDRDEASNCAERDLPMLKAYAKKHASRIPCRMFIFPYLYLSSPHDFSEKNKRLRKDLRNISDSNFYRLGKLLSAFRADAQADVREYLAMLFLLCDNPHVGFGPDENRLIWSSDVATKLAELTH